MKSQLIAIVAAVLLVGCGPVELDLTDSPIIREAKLSIAASTGNIETVKQLLAAGRDVNTKALGGKTPLHHAAMEGHKEIAELLIAKGADVNARNERMDATPLFMRLPFGAAAGHKEIIELLIAKGADVNARDKYGFTPLHWAIVGRADGVTTDKETAKLLIAKDADVNIPSNKGDSPLDNAIDLNLPEIADLLRKHGGKTAEELKAEGK
jgi:ankyrin repeat protein